MTIDELERIGEAMFGKRWRAELAGALGVSRQYPYDWSSGRKRITGKRAGQIYGLAQTRIRLIRDAIPENERFVRDE